MNRITRLLAIVLLLLLIAVVWIWWNRPHKVDMTAYVPVDSLVYLEANSLTDIAGALLDTDALKNLSPYMGFKANDRRDRWLTSFARLTGIGSTQSVIAARAQVALVLLDLHSTDDEKALDYKPLAALVVETHTSASRIKPTIEQLVGDFARRNYGQPVIERLNKDQAEFVKWTSPDGKRQIVVALDGTVAIIGNSEPAVSACLAVRRGQRPSLATQPDMIEMRKRMHADDALTFGYVSSTSAGRLLPELAPLFLLRKLPDQIGRCISQSTPRILGGVGWTARAVGGGIEDSYSIPVQSAVTQRLRSAFSSNVTPARKPAGDFLPPETFSATSYNFENPAAAWLALNTAIAAEQLDVLCSVVFREVSNISLVSYGIDDPQAFLRAVKAPVLTARLDADSARSVVIAGVADESALQQLVGRTFGAKRQTVKFENHELLVSDDAQAAASFVDGYFLLGSPEDIKRCLLSHAKPGAGNTAPAAWKTLISERISPESRNVVTYFQDGERVRGLITTLAKLRGRDYSSGTSTPEVERVVKALPYAVTETSLDDYGMQRRTRSPLGQFSSLFSLLSPAATK